MVLVIVSLAGIWCRVQASAAERRERAIALLRTLEATVVFDYQWSEPGEKGAWLPNATPPGSRFLKALLGDYYASNVVEVQLFNGSSSNSMVGPHGLNDNNIGCLDSLTEIRWLVLQDTSVTDVGLQQLSGLKKLERLDLDGSPVTDVGIARLQQALPNAEIYR